MADDFRPVLLDAAKSRSTVTVTVVGGTAYRGSLVGVAASYVTIISYPNSTPGVNGQAAHTYVPIDKIVALYVGPELARK